VDEVGTLLTRFVPVLTGAVGFAPVRALNHFLAVGPAFCFLFSATIFSNECEQGKKKSN
jgi:hypothetical protein